MLKHMFRTWKCYPLTTICVVLIWYLCLFKPPHTRLDTIEGIDKWAHITMYLGTCSVFWVEYLRSQHILTRMQLFIIATLSPILMSGAIELAQEYFTEYRSGDWADFLANSLGVLLALFVPLVYKYYHPNGHKL